MIRAKMFAKLFAACDKKVCFSFLLCPFFRRDALKEQYGKDQTPPDVKQESII
jgi:hypothetical protein